MNVLTKKTHQEILAKGIAKPASEETIPWNLIEILMDSMKRGLKKQHENGTLKGVPYLWFYIESAEDQGKIATLLHG